MTVNAPHKKIPKNIPRKIVRNDRKVPREKNVARFNILDAIAHSHISIHTYTVLHTKLALSRPSTTKCTYPRGTADFFCRACLHILVRKSLVSNHNIALQANVAAAKCEDESFSENVDTAKKKKNGGNLPPPFSE